MLYLDHNATTFIEPKVKELMLDLMEGGLNPSSVHAQGRFAKKIIENARIKVARGVGIDLISREYEIVFTASGTESNNLLLRNYYDGDIFIASIEHPSVFNHLRYAPSIKEIKVDSNGILDLEDLERLLFNSSSQKRLISVMMANNESGVIQNIKAIGNLAKKYNAKLHSDAVQAFGKIPVNVEELGLDYCTISGHKIGAGYGASCLIYKSNNNLSPLLIGGGQEKNLRSGTENVLAISCFGLACDIVTSEIDTRYTKMKRLRDILESRLVKYDQVDVVSKNVVRLPNTTLLTIKNTNAQDKLIAFDLRGVQVSSGSACSSGKVAKSNTLQAMGIDELDARSAIRVSTSYSQTEKDIDTFLKVFREIYKL